MPASTARRSIVSVTTAAVAACGCSQPGPRQASPACRIEHRRRRNCSTSKTPAATRICVHRSIMACRKSPPRRSLAHSAPPVSAPPGHRQRKQAQERTQPLPRNSRQGSNRTPRLRDRRRSPGSSRNNGQPSMRILSGEMPSVRLLLMRKSVTKSDLYQTVNGIASRIIARRRSCTWPPSAPH